jgi:hypothetical protein
LKILSYSSVSYKSLNGEIKKKERVESENILIILLILVLIDLKNINQLEYFSYCTTLNFGNDPFIVFLKERISFLG